MNTFAVVLGIMGLIAGYKIPDISLKIMEYKRGKDISVKPYLYSNMGKIIICILNSVMCFTAGLNVDNKIAGLLLCVQITLGLVVAFIDINIRIIPNELVIVMLAIGVLSQILNFGLKSIVTSLVTMAVMMVVFMSVAGFVGLGKVGAGDVKLAGAMGLALGYPTIISAVFVMAIVLLVFIVTGMLMKKIYLSTMLPLAPFMMCGYVLVLAGIPVL